MANMNDKPEIKLPLFGHLEELEALPAQARDRKFAITTAISPAPENSSGYLVELVGKRRAKVLAWLRGGGDAYACDAPISARPEREAELSLRHDRERIDAGDVYSSLGGESIVVARYRQYTNDENRIELQNAATDMGPYNKRHMDVDVTLATSFLAFYFFPLERGELDPWRSVADILDKLTAASYPDAVDELMYRGSKPSASAFERYAARELANAGAERIRSIAAQKDISLRRLASTRLFWTAAQSMLEPEEIDTLQSVEGALNRLALLDFEFTGDNGSPKLAAVGESSIEKFSRSVFTRFVCAAPSCVRGCERENPFATVCNTACKRGGEWDIRTRFAASAEKVRAPYSFGYTFDCDAHAGIFDIHASLPAVTAFPSFSDIPASDLRIRYALRLAALLASAAFGAGVGIVRTRVVLHERKESDLPVLAITFSRRAFTMGVIPAINSNSLNDLYISVDELLTLLEPVSCEMQLDAMGNLSALVEIEPLLPARPSMEHDTRSLPEHLANMLHANQVCDLDIYATDDDTLHDRLAEITNTFEPGDVEGIPALSDLISTYDAASMLEESSKKPLYCSNMVSRVYAGADIDPALEAEAPVRFRKLPDSAYDARVCLSRTLREVGNTEDALRIAQELVELAPSTFSSWHALALAYIELDQRDMAAEALVSALKVASVPNEINVGYYRLAYNIWQLGDAPLGLACYAIVNPRSQFGQIASEEMNELLQDNHIAAAPSRGEAETILRANGIPVAPTNALCDRAAKAAIELVDAGFLNAAENLTLFLSTINVAPNSHDILNVVSRSLEANE